MCNEYLLNIACNLFAFKKLSRDCSAALRHLEELQAQEFELDANLYAMCKNDVINTCYIVS